MKQLRDFRFLAKWKGGLSKIGNRGVLRVQGIYVNIQEKSVQRCGLEVLFYKEVHGNGCENLFQQTARCNIMDRRNMEKISASKGSNYKQTQIFGYKGPGEKTLDEDVISCLKFDPTGRFLALGDHAGRVIVFHSESVPKQKDEQLDYFTEFQSHTKQFDPLRSMEVEETINGLTWLQPQGKYLKILSTNSRSIKLWKIFEKAQKKVVKTAGRDLMMPRLQNVDSYLTSHLQVTFPTKHHSSINSIGVTHNEEYALSSDDVHCFMWNFEKPSKPYQLADLLKDNKIQDVNESINFSKIHPTSDSLFLYGTNKGTLKLCDLRVSSNCDATATNFKNQYSGQKNFLAELLGSYSAGEFTKQGKYIVSRDFLTVKIWDVCNSKKPISTININEGLKGKLSEMFENEAIFDKFSIVASPDGNTIGTGSYNNYFHMIDVDGSNTQYELNYKKSTVARQMVGKGSPLGRVDYMKKTTALDFHPTRNIMAVGSLNCFFLYGM